MLVTVVLGLLQGLVGLGQADTRPNIVFIMTDDQDKRLGSTDFMTSLHRDIMAKGADFSNHYTNTALCCPSRSTILRGQTVRKYFCKSDSSMLSDLKLGDVARVVNYNYGFHWVLYIQYR